MFGPFVTPPPGTHIAARYITDIHDTKYDIEKIIRTDLVMNIANGIADKISFTEKVNEQYFQKIYNAECIVLTIEEYQKLIYDIQCYIMAFRPTPKH